MPKLKVAKAGLRARVTRREEWRAFRRKNLFSQKRLAEHLGISIRSVQNVEGAHFTPIPAVLSRFATLKAMFANSGRRAT